MTGWRLTSSTPTMMRSLSSCFAAFQIVAHLVWFDLFLAENLAHRALYQMGETVVSRRRSVLARMASQKPRRPQLVRITVILGLVACHRHQPSLGLRCNRRLLARSGSVIEGRQGSIGQRPFDTALDRLVLGPESSSHRKKRWGLPMRIPMIADRCSD